MGIYQRTLTLILLLLGFATSGCANDPPLTQLGEPARQNSPVEVRGRAGELPFVGSDVVLLIDHSTLALLASGIDVDADGVVGRNQGVTAETGDRFAMPGRFWTTDSDDTIEALQLRVARALVARLAARHNRVGLASYTLRARTNGTSVVRLTEKPAIIVPVGEPAAVLEALEDFPAAEERRRTDLSRLLERGAELLDNPPSGIDPARRRAILLLSLGRPSAPDGLHWSSQRAIEYAGELAAQDIELWVIPLTSADADFLQELTRSGGGKVVPLDRLDAQFSASVPRERVDRRITEHAQVPAGAEQTP